MISFQNGISNPDRLREGAPGHKVLTGIVPFNVVRLGNGRWHKTVAGELIAEKDEATSAIADKLGRRPGNMRLVDDILDITGTEKSLGKRPLQDLREGKVTLPLLHALREAGGARENVTDELSHAEAGGSCDGGSVARPQTRALVFPESGLEMVSVP